MPDLADIVVIACVAFSVGMLAGVLIYAGRVDRQGQDPMNAPFGDVPMPPTSTSKNKRGGRYGV